MKLRASSSLPTRFALAAADAAVCFNKLNPYHLISHNELHQELQGDAKHLLNILEAKMTDMVQTAVNDSVVSSPLCDGTFTTFKIAEQQAALLRLLPFALLALPEVPLAKHLASALGGVNPCIPSCGANWRRS